MTKYFLQNYLLKKMDTRSFIITINIANFY